MTDEDDYPTRPRTTLLSAAYLEAAMRRLTREYQPKSAQKVEEFGENLERYCADLQVTPEQLQRAVISVIDGEENFPRSSVMKRHLRNAQAAMPVTGTKPAMAGGNDRTDGAEAGVLVAWLLGRKIRLFDFPWLAPDGWADRPIEDQVRSAFATCADVRRELPAFGQYPIAYAVGLLDEAARLKRAEAEQARAGVYELWMARTDPFTGERSKFGIRRDGRVWNYRLKAEAIRKRFQQDEQKGAA